VLALNVAEVALAGTVIEDGTLTSDEPLLEALLVAPLESTGERILESATTLLLVRDFESVTVQVVVALEARLAGAHCNEDRVGRVASESVAD
jgi:hypothetical protein